MTKKVALIIGAGGVLGTALSREFATAGYVVAGLRRGSATRQNTSPVNLEAAGTQMLHCDLQDATATRLAVEALVAEHGNVDVLVYNAAQLVIAPFAELKLSDFESTWRIGVAGALVCTQAVLPAMLKQQHGAIIFSGATAAVRGTAKFAAFASAKFALRGLAQSLAREYQSQGIHVAHVVLDGLLRGSSSIKRFSGHDDHAIDPAAVASTYRWLAEQTPATWTHEIDIRPSSEKF